MPGVLEADQAAAPDHMAGRETDVAYCHYSSAGPLSHGLASWPLVWLAVGLSEALLGWFHPFEGQGLQLPWAQQQQQPQHQGQWQQQPQRQGH